MDYRDAFFKLLDGILTVTNDKGKWSDFIDDALDSIEKIDNTETALNRASELAKVSKNKEIVGRAVEFLHRKAFEGLEASKKLAS